MKRTDSGPVCQPRAGSLVLSLYSAQLGNEIRLPAKSDVHVVDLRLSAEALLRATSFPIAERLRSRFANSYGTHGHESLVVSCSASHDMLKLAQSLSSTPLADPSALRLWRRARTQELLAHVIELLATHGKSVHAYLRETRLSHAADQLAGGVSVTQVALAVGYENLSHFGKAFRAQFGVLPSEWKSTTTTATTVLASA